MELQNRLKAIRNNVHVYRLRIELHGYQSNNQTVLKAIKCTDRYEAQEILFLCNKLVNVAVNVEINCRTSAKNES